jgi:hypothetical protein
MELAGSALITLGVIGQPTMQPAVVGGDAEPAPPANAQGVTIDVADN